jgi:hypothetical protein
MYTFWYAFKRVTLLAVDGIYTVGLGLVLTKATCWRMNSASCIWRRRYWISFSLRAASDLGAQRSQSLTAGNHLLKKWKQNVLRRFHNERSKQTTWIDAPEMPIPRIKLLNWCQVWCPSALRELCEAGFMVSHPSRRRLRGIVGWLLLLATAGVVAEVYYSTS